MLINTDNRRRPLPAVRGAAIAGCLCALLTVTGCSSSSPPPSSPPSSPSSLPGGAPSTPSSSPPSQPSSSPSGSSGSSGSQQPSGGQSGSSGGLPGQQSGGQSGAGGAPGGAFPDGETGGQSSPGGSAGGGMPETGTSGGGPAGSGQPGSAEEDGWESGLPGRGGDGWETSNQIPGGGESRIPPMPSERGKPPGSGDGELDGALEDFDGEILAEREVIRQRSNETAGAGGGGTSLPDSGPGDPAAAGGTIDMPTRGGPMGVPSNRNVPPPPSPVASAGVPDDIPDAKDDDIIARQLREAAMQETDPALKEKLWDEYRRYKGI